MAKASYQLTHAPGAERWYGLDLGEWLASISEDGVAGAATWTCVAENDSEDPAELEIDDQAELNADNEASGDRTKIAVRLIGGTEGIDYLVQATWTTDPDGDIDKRTIRVRCRER